MINPLGGSLIALLQLGIHLSSSSYSANYSHFKGTLHSQSTISEFGKPVFFVYMQNNSLFIIIRGSITGDDYRTDAEISETTTDYGVFHTGFYLAATHVYENTKTLINSWRGPVFFVGHSYGASVSQVLMAMSYHYKNDLDAYALSYAPMPAMNITTNTHIHDRIITIVNDDDIVPTLSIPNVYTKFNFLFPAISKIPLDQLVNSFDTILRLMKLTNTADSRLLANLWNSVPVIIRSAQEFEKGVPKHVRYPAGAVYKLKINKPKTLANARINPETDLNAISTQLNAISDHNSDNYIKVVEQILEDN